MTGTYQVSLPLPGGDRTCRLEIVQDGAAITGYITNPYQDQEKCPIYDGTISDSAFEMKANVGRTVFIFRGKAEKDALKTDFITHETIPLEPGKKISGESGVLEGEYLIGVYSPGGVKENHFVITREGDAYGGEMFCLMDEKTLEFMKTMMAEPPAGAPQEMPPMKLPKPGDKCDINPFLSVTGNEKAFEITTKTGNGSLFVFQGALAGDAMTVTLHVTDSHEDLQARKI